MADVGALEGPNSMKASIYDVDELLYSSDALDSFWATDSTTSFHGAETMVNFDGDDGGTDANKSVLHAADEEEAGVEDYGGSFFPLSGRKRRLTAGQVELLERNFEAENKLEPERKIRIARELGLEPRQVAIWFQNRRARFKTKQLEKDYESLRASHDNLKAKYRTLLKENKRLKLEVKSLQDKKLMNQVPGIATEVLIKQQEDASSAKSDVVDSENPNFGYPTNFGEFDQQRSFLGPLLQMPHLGGGFQHDPSSATAADFGFSFGGEEEQPFWHWNF